MGPFIVIWNLGHGDKSLTCFTKPMGLTGTLLALATGKRSITVFAVFLKKFFGAS